MSGGTGARTTRRWRMRRGRARRMRSGIGSGIGSRGCARRIARSETIRLRPRAAERGSGLRPASHPRSSSTRVATRTASAARAPCSRIAEPIHPRSEGTVSDDLFLGRQCRRLLLLDRLIHHEGATHEPLALHGLDGGVTDLRIANHDDRETLRLVRRRIRRNDQILDGAEHREKLAELLDLHLVVEVPDIDLEHRVSLRAAHDMRHTLQSEQMVETPSTMLLARNPTTTVPSKAASAGPRRRASNDNRHKRRDRQQERQRESPRDDSRDKLEACP